MMKWKFWQKNTATTAEGETKRSRPKDLPEIIGRYLVVNMGMDPDQVWNLKAVMRPNQESSSRKDVRIYDPIATNNSGIAIRSYDSFEVYQEMILFEGWFDKKNNQLEIKTKNPERVTAA